MSQVKDFFFDEFYAELLQIITYIKNENEKIQKGSILFEDLKNIWDDYKIVAEAPQESLIAVDGGVQISNFAYGEFVAVGRACAIIQRHGQDRKLEKKVKVYIDKVYDNRDKGFIPGYVRTICEYEAAYSAALHVIEEGGNPVILLDGSLYFSRFPYAIREYRHHPVLLKELFDAISKLRCLGRDMDIPIIAVSKDSSVFYLYMELLRKKIQREGEKDLLNLIKDASTPMDLWVISEKLNDDDKEVLKPFIESRPLCDTKLIEFSNIEEGYSQPLYVAPSIYYSRDRTIPAFYNLLDKTLEKETSKKMKESFEAFFGCPGVATIYWKPKENARVFRVDILSSILGDNEPWSEKKRNELMRHYNKERVEKILYHLNYWYCNDVEYNLPLKQADMLARFDRKLYRDKYEPFIIRRLEEAGLEVRGTRRMLREF
ncbi:DNA double-strand break repair nuclease NurA [Candidatus Bathyarchaeota archaeon]|nr:DNA double-strand break repair nuclease NurA [Candidatus Bathyarchaeota archaeon]